MHTFTIRDLRDRTGELVRTAEDGELSVVTKHGQPVFVAVPFDLLLLKNGAGVALAVNFFKEKTLGLNRAAKLAGMPLESFMKLLGKLGVPLMDFTEEELDKDLDALEAMSR